MNNIPEIEITAEPYVRVGREDVRGYLSIDPHFTINPGVTFTGGDFEMHLTLPNDVTVTMQVHAASEEEAVRKFTETAQQIAALQFGWKPQR